MRINGILNVERPWFLGIVPLLAVFLLLLSASKSVSAHDIKVQVHSRQDGSWKPLKDATVCASFNAWRDDKKTTYSGGNIANALRAMEPRRTDAQGKHNIDIGDFNAFDGSIVVAIKKKGK